MYIITHALIRVIFIHIPMFFLSCLDRNREGVESEGEKKKKRKRKRGIEGEIGMESG